MIAMLLSIALLASSTPTLAQDTVELDTVKQATAAYKSQVKAAKQAYLAELKSEREALVSKTAEAKTACQAVIADYERAWREKQEAADVRKALGPKTDQHGGMLTFDGPALTYVQRLGDIQTEAGKTIESALKRGKFAAEVYTSSKNELERIDDQIMSLECELDPSTCRTAAERGGLGNFISAEPASQRNETTVPYDGAFEGCPGYTSPAAEVGGYYPGR